MKRILVLDDKDHAVRQVRHSLDETTYGEVDLVHCRRMSELAAYGDAPWHIAFIDFFLDFDRRPGTDALPLLRATYIVGFSSMQAGSDAIRAEALKSGRWTETRAFAIRKRKESVANDELFELFVNIMI